MKNVSNVGSVPHVIQVITTFALGGEEVEVVTMKCHLLDPMTTPWEIENLPEYRVVGVAVFQGVVESYVWLPVTSETKKLLGAIAAAGHCELDFTFVPNDPFPLLTQVRHGLGFLAVYTTEEEALTAASNTATM